MTMNYNAEEFDEDVVIEGSELHRTLLQIGFTDFETVSPQKEIIEPKISDPLVQRNAVNNYGIFDKLDYLYEQIFKEDQFIISEKLLTVLTLEPLLDDHANNIQGLISEKPSPYWRTVSEWLPIVGTSIATIVSSLTRQEKFITILLASSTGFCLYNKSMKFASVHDLKTLINQQNSLYNNVKKCLKILRNDYRLRKNDQKPGNKFLAFKKNHFKFLMPLLSSLIRSLEQISLLDYRISKHILSLLPSSVKLENVLTMFDEESFILKDEVTYDNLKSLYFIYLLTQSEMLNLLALAYSQKSGNPGFVELEHKFNYLINHLTQRLKGHNTILSKILDDYNACDFRIVHRKFRGSDSKWQDVYLQLDVSSQKLQTSYFLISSILNRIDNQSEENTDDEELIKMLSEKMNETQKQVESAHSFLNLATLLLMRRQHINQTNDLEPDDENRTRLDISKPTSSAATNPEHEILDEVFEEYIKEEYLKPFYEEDDDYFYDQKINKFLSKHYMQELKQVLVDKHKIMSEREARALQRMYGNVLKDDDQNTEIPLPPPPPLACFNSKLKSERRKYEEEDEQENDVNLRLTISEKASARKSVISLSSLPKEEKEDMTLQFSMGAHLPKKPTVSFLKEEEETFFGSGENSEEEMMSNASEQEDS